MPYKTNKDLPNNVKDNIPENAQDIWRNAFNSAFDKYNDDGRASQIAWGALKNAGWEKDESGNWKKLHYELKDVEIFSAGVHKGERYTESDLDDIVTAFDELRDRIKPPLKLAHINAMHKKDGQPALGWLTDVRRVGTKLVASFAEVPRLVKEAISKKLYKRVSSEIYNNLMIGGKKYKRALAAVGLLGSDIPEVKDLQDIEIFFSDNDTVITAHEFDVQNGIINYTEENIMDIKEVEALFEKKLALMQAEIDKVKADSKAALDAQALKFTEEKATLEGKLLEKEKIVKIEELKTFCESQVSAGVLTPAERDEIMKDIDKVNFSENDELSIPFKNFKAAVEKRKAILDKSERGFYIPAEKREKVKSVYTEKQGVMLHDADLDAEAKKYMRENKVDYAEALTEVLSQNTDLAEQFAETGVVIKEGK